MMNLIRRIYKELKFGGGKYECVICKRKVRSFFPFSEGLQSMAKKYGFTYSFDRMETLNVENCNCPFCLSNDRERLYVIFLEKYFKERKLTSYKMLDFAPNDEFVRYFKNKKEVHYYSADLFKPNVDYQLDICNMSAIPDAEFDVIICSHILEHVSDPQKALRELNRILKKGGIAILMVPLFWEVEQTIENPQHTSEEDRWKYYGQYDHVRLYSKKDFVTQIQNAYFTVKEYTIKDFEASLIRKNAISSNSILYVGYKE